MTISEWVLDICLYTADVGRAGRGTSMYVQPGGENVGDFVSSRVTPIIEASDYLQGRVPQAGTKQPYRIGLTKVGEGFTFWRTAGVGGRGSRNRSGLKSVPADTLVLDEYDEMPEGTLELASHRLDSSRAPWTRVISTPTYPDTGIDRLYSAGDRRRYYLTCTECGVAQHLDWDANVVVGEDGKRHRVCRDCGESLEALILRAWSDESAGEWRVTWPAGEYPSYHISQLYRPGIDLDAIHDALNSTDLLKQQEAYNQHLGVPYNPPGGRFPYVREYFEGMRYDSTEPRWANQCIARFISWDTAMKDTKVADYTSCAVWELMPDYMLHLREIYRARLTFPELPSTIEAVARRHNRDDKLRGVIIEDKGSGTSAYQTLLATAEPWLRDILHPFLPQGPKEFRAQQAAVWARERCLRLPHPHASVPWLRDFEEELFGFPILVQHDDQVDAFDQGILFLEHYLEAGRRARMAQVNEQSIGGLEEGLMLRG